MRDILRIAAVPYFFTFRGGRVTGSFTISPTLSNKRKGAVTLTLALSPQGRGNL